MGSVAEQFQNQINHIVSEIEMLLNPAIIETVSECCHHIVNNLNFGHRIFICGNGGSAADAQHFAAELVGRFKSNKRRPLPCIALTVDTSALTAIANDFSYEDVFSRQLQALALPGDILIGISTSGNSANIINAVKKAKELDVFLIGLLGRDGGKLRTEVDIPIIVPSEETDSIQQGHLIIEHFICAIIDKEFE